MHDEAEEIEECLQFASYVVKHSDTVMQQRIWLIYQEARQLTETIPLMHGSVRQRIVVCLQRLEPFKAQQDYAGVGWLLAAIVERLGERDIPEWPRLKAIADETIGFISRAAPIAH